MIHACIFGIDVLGMVYLTPKYPNCIYWQQRDFGQLTTNGVFFFL